MVEALTKKDLSRVEVVSTVKCKNRVEFASIWTKRMLLSGRAVGGTRLSVNCITKI